MAGPTYILIHVFGTVRDELDREDPGKRKHTYSAWLREYVAEQPQRLTQIARLVDVLTENCIRMFDECVRALHDPDDVTAGFISIVDRQGKERRYPLVSVSIGVAVTGRRHYADHRAIVAVATEMKVVAKAKSGSAVAVDRRTDAELGRGDGAAAGEVHTA